MEYINIGKIYTTHGLKGEVKVRIDFKDKDKILIKDFIFYCGDSKEELHLEKIRNQNELELLTFKEITDIDIAKNYRGKLLYAKRSDIDLDILDSDLIGYKCIYKDKEIGKVKKIEDQGLGNIVIEIDTGTKSTFIPKNENFINTIDTKSGTIFFNNLEGLL